MNKKVKNALLWALTIIVAIALGFGVQHVVATTRNSAIKNTKVDFTVTDKLATPFKLSDFEGKPVVVNFWAIWCGPCVAELPVMQKAFEEYSGKVEFVFINVLKWQNNNVTEVENFLSENGYTFHTYYDTMREAEQACNVQAIPLTLFIDKTGKVVYTYNSSISASVMDNYIQKIINS